MGSRLGTVLVLLLLPACNQPGGNDCAAVNIAGRCLACPPGSTLRVSRERISGRTSGASMEERWCEQNGTRVGPYAKWREARYFISGGFYDAAGRKHGEWVEWDRYGYGGRQSRGDYVHDQREGEWVELSNGRALCTKRYAAGRMVQPCR